jgi:hypothetical protein
MYKKIAAFNAHDVKGIRALLDPDVEWAIPGGCFEVPIKRSHSSLRFERHFPTSS